MRFGWLGFDIFLFLSVDSNWSYHDIRNSLKTSLVTLSILIMQLLPLVLISIQHLWITK